MSMTGRQIVPGTPKDEPQPRYETVEGPGGSPGQGAALRRLAGAREPGEWSPGSQQRAQRLWGYAQGLRDQGKVSIETDEGGVDNVYGKDVSTGEDRKLYRGFQWLHRQNRRAGTTGPDDTDLIPGEKP